MLPYVITIAHPDYKRPYVSQDFGVIKKDEMNTFFLAQVCYFILDRERNIKSIEDVTKFFDNYYSDSYMSNSPWEARIFINKKWKYVTPSNDEIWDYIQTLSVSVCSSDSEDEIK